MPRFINVTLGCDWEDCTTVGAEGDDTVTEETLSYSTRQPKTFLICKKHRDELDEILMPLLTKGAAAAPKKKTNGNGGVECKECGRTDIKNRAGLAQHVLRSHDFTSLAEYEAKHGITID